MRASLFRSAAHVATAIVLCAAFAHAADATRQKTNINAFWKYQQGDIAEARAPAFNDGAWQSVGLPHSFSIPYFMSPDFYVGYSWYRKHLTLPASATGRRVSLEFDGVFQEAEVFVNGTPVGNHQGGYTGFSLDITSAVRKGDKRDRGARQQRVESATGAARRRTRLQWRHLSQRISGGHRSAARGLVRDVRDHSAGLGRTRGG